ncbi:uncharacterized protein LOC132195635 [Neocloeon triangulifer]|uniref:uncharacterized protein LOC132195635 n=1 Tax=Neocloeon triangulifer TaxID=2078957 RepID=UPI00286F0201|nr:uncharacterized protein LOC132195635 [Neocloeon triangulifer]
MDRLDRGWLKSFKVAVLSSESTRVLSMEASTVNNLQLNEAPLQLLALREVVSLFLNPERAERYLSRELLMTLTDESKTEVLARLSKLVPKFGFDLKTFKSVLPSANGRLQTYDFNQSAKLLPPVGLVELLINKELEEIDLVLLAKCSDEEILRFWQRLSDHSVNLQEIRNANVFLSCETPLDNLAITNCIIRLRNLKYLDASMCCLSDNNLGLVVKCCKSLQTICMQRSANFTTKGVEHLKKLPNLKEIFIGSDYFKQMTHAELEKAANIQVLFEKLPRLKVLCSLAKLEYPHFYEGRMQEEGVTITLLPKLETCYDLEVVYHVAGQVHRLPELLPNVKSVFINYTRNEAIISPEILVKMEHLEMLLLSGRDHGRLSLHSLQSVGPRLNQLTLLRMSFAIDVYEVLDLCPNVANLTIEGDLSSNKKPSKPWKGHERVEKICLASGDVFLSCEMVYWEVLLGSPRLKTVCLYNLVFTDPGPIDELFYERLTAFGSCFLIGSQQALECHNQFMRSVLESPNLKKFVCSVRGNRLQETSGLTLADVLGDSKCLWRNASPFDVLSDN